jgi:hypothetical protein
MDVIWPAKTLYWGPFGLTEVAAWPREPLRPLFPDADMKMESHVLRISAEMRFDLIHTGAKSLLNSETEVFNWAGANTAKVNFRR